MVCSKLSSRSAVTKRSFLHTPFIGHDVTQGTKFLENPSSCDLHHFTGIFLLEFTLRKTNKQKKKNSTPIPAVTLGQNLSQLKRHTFQTTDSSVHIVSVYCHPWVFGPLTISINVCLQQLASGCGIVEVKCCHCCPWAFKHKRSHSNFWYGEGQKVCLGVCDSVEGMKLRSKWHWMM